MQPMWTCIGMDPFLFHKAAVYQRGPAALQQSQFLLLDDMQPGEDRLARPFSNLSSEDLNQQPKIEPGNDDSDGIAQSAEHGPVHEDSHLHFVAGKGH